MKNRDYGVEVIRIIATFIVIGTHVKLNWIVGDVVQNLKLVYTCLWADGVSLFFLITGFFLFNGRNYGQILKKCVKSIVVPVLLVAVVSQFIGPWIHDGRLFGFGVEFGIPLLSMGRAILQQNAGDVEFCFHFWYIFTYVKVLLSFPLLKWICQDDKEPNLARRVLVAMSLLYLCVSNFKSLVSIDLNLYNFFDTAVLLVVIGFEISVHKQAIKNNKALRRVCGILCVMLEILRFYAQKQLNEVAISNSLFINWNSIFGVLISALFFVLVYSFDFDRAGDKAKSIISMVSQTTFYIYLIHVIVYFKLEAIGVRQKAVGYFDNGFWGILCFNIIYPLGVFLICMGLSLGYIRFKRWGKARLSAKKLA